MPRGPTLYLLGAQRETLDFFPGAIIESDAADAKHDAITCQIKWFEHPDFDQQHDYGYALRKWAQMARNKGALAWADKLLEGPAVRAGEAMEATDDT